MNLFSHLNQSDWDDVQEWTLTLTQASPFDITFRCRISNVKCKPLRN